MPDPRQTHRFGVIVGCAAVLAAASQALGNPGTTGWTVIAHMIVGNLIIGVAEGLIARQLGAGWWAVPILIVVNYLSAAAGMAAASWAFEPLVAALHDDPLRAVGTASWLAMGVLALLGLVLEAPAFLVCFVRREGMLRRAALALVAGNAATHRSPLLVLGHRRELAADGAAPGGFRGGSAHGRKRTVGVLHRAG